MIVRPNVLPVSHVDTSSWSLESSALCNYAADLSQQGVWARCPVVELLILAASETQQRSWALTKPTFKSWEISISFSSSDSVEFQRSCTMAAMTTLLPPICESFRSLVGQSWVHVTVLFLCFGNICIEQMLESAQNRWFRRTRPHGGLADRPILGKPSARIVYR